MSLDKVDPAILEAHKLWRLFECLSLTKMIANISQVQFSTVLSRKSYHTKVYILQVVSLRTMVYVRVMKNLNIKLLLKKLILI